MQMRAAINTLSKLKNFTYLCWVYSKIALLYFFFSDGDYDVSMTQQRIQELNKHIYLLELNSRKPVHGSGGRYRLQTNGTLSIRQVWSLTYLHLSKGPISNLQQHIIVHK